LALLTFAAMKQKKYSIENILSNLNIEALNEMQLAAVDANKKKEDIICRTGELVIHLWKQNTR